MSSITTEGEDSLLVGQPLKKEKTSRKKSLETNVEVPAIGVIGSMSSSIALIPTSPASASIDAPLSRRKTNDIQAKARPEGEEESAETLTLVRQRTNVPSGARVMHSKREEAASHVQSESASETVTLARQRTNVPPGARVTHSKRETGRLMLSLLLKAMSL